MLYERGIAEQVARNCAVSDARHAGSSGIFKRRLAKTGKIGG